MMAIPKDSQEREIRLALVKMMLSRAKLALEAGHLVDARDYVRAIMAVYPKNPHLKGLLGKIRRVLREQAKK